MEILYLGITLFVSIFLLIGAIVVFLSKNNEKFIDFSISIAFGVMMSLMILELMPEASELISDTKGFPSNLLIVLVGIVIGFVVIKVLDLFIPDHDNDDNHNLFHIGLISSIALVLHNIIEGMAIYTSLTTSLHLGLLLCIGVGLHNIPLGMVITSTFYKSNNSKKKTILTVFLISLSTLIGGLVIFILKDFVINNLVLGILLAVTIGMLIYITLLELLPKIIKSKYHLICITGLLLGVITMLSTCLFHSH